jgi:nucleotide-binding universal stress UspA family protein
VAKKRSCNVETELLQAREVGPALVEEAVERGIDLIIIGTNYKTPFGEFSLGDTAPYILKNAPCRVWLCRKSIPEELREEQ